MNRSRLGQHLDVPHSDFRIRSSTAARGRRVVRGREAECREYADAGELRATG